MIKIKNTVSKNSAKIILLLLSLTLGIILIEAINYITVEKNKYYVWEPNLQNTFYPNSSIMNGIFGESKFSINSLGYRGPEIIDKEKEYRILFIGGSTTECLYLDDSETWPNLIMEKLNTTKDNKKIISMNIGKSGFNTRNHIVELKYLSEQYNPDLVVIMTGANDMLLRLSKRWVWKPFEEDTYDIDNTFYITPGYSLKSTISYKIFNLIFNSKSENNILKKGIVKNQDNSGEYLTQKRLERKSVGASIYSDPGLETPLKDYEKNINRVIEIAKERNMVVIFLTQPYLWKENMTEEEDFMLWMTTDFNGNFYPTKTMIESMDQFNKKLLEICLKNKEILCIDLEKKISKSLDYFYDDMHFNEKGARLVAEKIAKFIGENLEKLTISQRKIIRV